jgi:hypothetical protein
MTAYDERYLKEAKEAGATTTVRKPTELPYIADVVSRVLGRRMAQGGH